MDKDAEVRPRSGSDEPADELARIYRYATDCSPLPLVATDGHDHIVCYVNPAFCRLSSRQREELVGRPFTEAVLGGTSDGCQHLLDLVYRTGDAENLPDQEHSLGPVAGARWSYSAWAVRDDEGRPVGVMMEVTDTTASYHARLLACEMNQALVLSDVRQHEMAEEGAERLRLAMRETDHRVKNHLQSIGSLLDMQVMANREAVPVTALNQIRMHIRTLASIHGMLTHSAAMDPVSGTMSARAMLDAILPMWREIIGMEGLKWRVDDVRLPHKQSVALAVATNELINNAFKHGGHSIEVRLEALGPSATLTVGDDGPGFGPSFDPVADANIGLELIETVARTDLRGRTRYENRPGGGACVSIVFPLAAPQAGGPPPGRDAGP